MRWRVPLALSAGVLLAAWGLCVLILATQSGDYNWPLLGVFAGVALAFTAGAAVVLGLAWDGEATAVAFVPATVLAVGATLLLAVLIRLSG